MKYGYFDNANKEYVIQTYNTPLPWINYLSNGNMFSIITNYGGGYTYFKDAKLRRITRYFYNASDRDNGGIMIYIDDGKEVFSPTFYPSKTPLDTYECHVGINYQRFISTKNGLDMDLLAFIPRKDNVVIYKLVLKNNTNTTKELLTYGGVEFCLWNAIDDSSNFQRNFSTGEVEILKNIIVHKTEYRERRNHYAYFASNKDVSSYQSDRDTFLGIHNDYNSPIEIKNKKLGNNKASGYAPVAFHQHELNLKPGEEVTLIYLLGYNENKNEEKFDKDGNLNFKNSSEIVSYNLNEDNVNKSYEELVNYNNNLLSAFSLSCPDNKLDAQVNIWHQYQCLMTYHLSRSASYYESGMGRGMGFRDSCQDLLGFVHLIPSKAKERLIDLASIMFKDGSTYHQYQPLDKKGNADIGGGFNDDPLWFVGATYAYISETKDFSILDMVIPYNNSTTEKGTYLEHVKNAVYHTINNLGPHGLPLIGHADWNDCLNLNCFSSNPGESFQTLVGNDGGIAESIFIGAMFVKYAKEYLEILHKIGQDDENVKRHIDMMKENMYKHGFENDHFLRAYDAFGNKVGSDENEDGQIYIEPQGFAVLAGLGLENGMATKALDATYNRLNTKYGICILSPCYKRYHIELGEVSSYPCGYKENGGIFTHNNPWVIIAECLNNNPDRAFMYYKEITPIYIEDNIAIRKVEPYVYCQMMGGKEAPNFGQGKNSWLTGTASWSFVAISQYMLGIKPTLDGLKIEPRMPKDINEFVVNRTYLGHKITIKAHRGDNPGVFVENKKIENNLIKGVDKDIEVLVTYR